MEAKSSRARQLLFFIALALTNIIIMKDNVIYPISYIFYELFPEQTMGVNFMMSGPALFIVVSSLMVPWLMKYISKKALLVISCIAFTLTSAGGALILSLPWNGSISLSQISI